MKLKRIMQNKIMRTLFCIILAIALMLFANEYTGLNERLIKILFLVAGLGSTILGICIIIGGEQ